MSDKRFSNKQNFNKTNLKKVPKQSGVYELLNKKGEIEYVGSAGAGRLKERLQEHLEEKDIHGAGQFRFKPTSGTREARALEKKLIKSENPPQNEQNNGEK